MTKKQIIELRQDIEEGLKQGCWIFEITKNQKRFLEKNDGFDYTIAFEETEEKDTFTLYIF